MSFITNLKHVTVGEPMVIIQIQDFDFLALNIAANKLLFSKRGCSSDFTNEDEELKANEK